MITKQLYEKTSEEMKEVSPLVSIEAIYSKLSDTPLEALVSLFNHVKCEWKGSVSDTRRTVPLFLRRSGLFITYNNGTKYITEFFSAGTDQITTEDWVKDSNWTSVPDEDYISAGVKPGVGTIGYEQLNDNLKQLFREKVNVTNFPDDEDIASVDNMLKLKDREADAAKFQSKGYVILRKNLRLINGVVKNILTQDMINQPNTIYEIRYDFDLNASTIEVPSDCILKFEGGSLNNGELNPNNVYIYNNTDKCIFYNISFKDYNLFNDKLVFQDYWIDNIFKSKILGYVRYFNLTQSHIYDNQEDLADDKVANLHKGGIVIYGNNNSIIFNTDNWTKKSFVLLECEYIYIYNVNLVQNHPTSLLTDCISTWFNSKVFHFINSTFNGYGRLNVNWSWWADKDSTRPDKGIGSELKFINSSCKSHSFISEGRFDKVIIENSEILRPKNRKDYDDKIWGPECLSIGCNSTGYTNRDECYMYITNSKLSNNLEEISHSMAYNENGIAYNVAGWEGLNDRGYKYITVENSVLYNFIIVPEDGTRDGRWNTMDTICTYNNCTFTYTEYDYTVHHIKLNLHNKYIFNNCILAINIIIQSTHHVEFNNCIIKNSIDGSDMKLIPDDFKCIFKNTTLECTPIFFKSLNSEQLKKYVSFINVIYQNSNIRPVIHSSDKIFYIPFDGFIIIELNLYEMLTDNIVHGYLKAPFGQETYGTTIKPIFYNPEIQDFEFEDGTNINYITY